MHYHAEIHLNDLKDVDRQVDKILAPYSKSLEWDWYQIGGRWTGAHDKYDPESDPDNMEICDLCNGAGKRSDMDCSWCGGCNGCQGKGKRVVWPTQFKRHAGDIVPVSSIADDLDCHTLIANGKVLQIEQWNGESFIKTDFDGKVKSTLVKLGIDSGYLVTVDYHI